MATTTLGNKAEAVVARLLHEQGFEILTRNWKTKICEIDIVAKHNKVIYFIEVKYRVSGEQGSGLEHITPRKLNQIKFAVRVWCQANNWHGDCRITGAEISGPEFKNVELVEID